MSLPTTSFSKKSRRAILIFAISIVGVVLIPRTIFLFREPTKLSIHQSDFEKKAFQEARFDESNYNQKQDYKKGSKFSVPDKKFDPNTYVASDWIKLGLSPKQAEVLMKFGKRGFRSNEDLKKVFVISDELFALIKDSTFYSEKQVYKPAAESTNTESKKSVLIAINSASEEELMRIPGVGSFFAKSIIKRRDQLGGYVSKDQVLEAWKMTPEKLEEINPFFTIDIQDVKKININTAQAEDLKNHPYISWNVANSIVKLRAQKGGTFQSVEDIRKSVLIDADLFAKLKPYLMVE